MADQLNARILINDWILEYSLPDIWEEFKENKLFSKETFELITVLSKREYSSNDDDYVAELLSFLVVLYYLNESRKPIRLGDEVIEGHDEPLTPLEELQTNWFTLVNFQSEEALQAIGVGFVSLIKQAAIHVCLRQGKKQLARRVFHRLFTDEDVANDTTGEVKSTKEMLTSRRSKPTEAMYTKLVDEIISYLDEVAANFEPPRLLLAAEKYMKTKCSQNASGSEQDECTGRGDKFREPVARERHSPARKRYSRDILQTAKGQLESEDQSAVMEGGNARLKRFWSKNNKEMFNESSEQPGSSSQVDVDSQQETQTPPTAPTDSASTSCTAQKKRKPSSPETSPRRSGRDIVPSKPRPDPSPSKSRAGSDSTASKPRPGSDSTPSKVRPGSDTTPSKRKSGSDSRMSPGRPSHASTPSTSNEFKKPKCADGAYPGLKYRKNVGRPDRHQPPAKRAMSVVSDIDDDARSSISSISSASSIRQKWSWEETVKFYSAVKKIGEGKWSLIQEEMGTTRTQVQLKDKWRNIVTSADHTLIERLDRELDRLDEELG